MKVLFLDIDGVVNSKTTTEQSRGLTSIDRYMAFLVGKIQLDTDCKVVLSSSWRHFKDGVEEVKRQVVDIFDTTALGEEAETIRGNEIKKWLDVHPEVTKYAILDDNEDMLPEQMPNFFKTSYDIGLTDEIAKSVTEHLNGVQTEILHDDW